MEKVNEKAAHEMLALFRKLVQPFNTQNHTIKIVYSMGSATVKVDSKFISKYHRPSPLIDLLQEIDQALDGANFSVYLAGELLN